MSTRQGQPRNLREEIGKRRAFEAPEQEAYLNLARTFSILHAAVARLFKDHGLSDPQYNALRIIVGSGAEGIRSETMGERMIAHDPDTTRLIDRLQKAGLVERRKDPDDRRCVKVIATRSGRALVEKLHEPLLELHRAQLGHLKRTELRQLNDLLFRARHP
jgi:DNA-binding MarR family transcriptional regulator